MVLCRSTNTLKALEKWEFANHPLGGWSVPLQQAITKQPGISLHSYMQISFREVLCQHARRGSTKRPTFTLLHKIHNLFVFARSYRVQMKRRIDTGRLQGNHCPHYQEFVMGTINIAHNGVWCEVRCFIYKRKKGVTLCGARKR